MIFKRKRFAILGSLFWICFFLSGNFVWSGDTSEEILTKVPDATDLLKYSKVSSVMVSSQTFRPIGWSKDGKFAYILEQPIDGRGGTLFTYRILDAVTDETVWIAKDDSFQWPDDKWLEVGSELAVSWENNRKAFNKALGKNKILANKGTEFSPFPVNFRKDLYNVNVIVVKDDNSGVFYDKVKSFSVHVISDFRGSKRITGSDDVQCFNVDYAGYFRSPFEQRILVVLFKEKYGFECHVPEFFFSGAHLLVGFKK